MRQKKCLIVVADGERAKFLTKDKMDIVPVQATTHRPDELPTHKDLGSGKPGTGGHNAGSSFHAMTPHTDYHRAEKDAFAHEISQKVNEMQDAYEEIILIAPPLVLGELRKHITKNSHEKIVLEINKDLTKLPLHELQPYVTPPYV